MGLIAVDTTRPISKISSDSQSATSLATLPIVITIISAIAIVIIAMLVSFYSYRNNQHKAVVPQFITKQVQYIDAQPSNNEENINPQSIYQDEQSTNIPGISDVPIDEMVNFELQTNSVPENI